LSPMQILVKAVGQIEFLNLMAVIGVTAEYT
ncbi:unnamed protein product, partial [marine sediment metagenome]